MWPLGGLFGSDSAITSPSGGSSRAAKTVSQPAKPTNTNAHEEQDVPDARNEQATNKAAVAPPARDDVTEYIALISNGAYPNGTAAFNVSAAVIEEHWGGKTQILTYPSEPAAEGWRIGRCGVDRTWHALSAALWSQRAQLGVRRDLD